MQVVQTHILKHISYQNAWDYQGFLQQKLLHYKREHGIKSGSGVVHHLLFCIHNPVYTLGKTGTIDHLLLNENERLNQDIEFFKINRGGDITYHGPGQLTVYPILDLEYFYRDVHKYVRQLEEVVIDTLDNYSISGSRIDDYTGVWINEVDQVKRKICAIGVHMSRWVSLHGFALNVNTDLEYFNKIIPCGIQEEDKTVTSMEKELGVKLNPLEVIESIKLSFAKIFDVKYISI